MTTERELRQITTRFLNPGKSFNPNSRVQLGHITDKEAEKLKEKKRLKGFLVWVGGTYVRNKHGELQINTLKSPK